MANKKKILKLAVSMSVPSSCNSYVIKCGFKVLIKFLHNIITLE